MLNNPGQPHDSEGSKSLELSDSLKLSDSAMAARSLDAQGDFMDDKELIKATALKFIHEDILPKVGHTELYESEMIGPKSGYGKNVNFLYTAPQTALYNDLLDIAFDLSIDVRSRDDLESDGVLEIESMLSSNRADNPLKMSIRINAYKGRPAIDTADYNDHPFDFMVTEEGDETQTPVNYVAGLRFDFSALEDKLMVEKTDYVTAGIGDASVQDIADMRTIFTDAFEIPRSYS